MEAVELVQRHLVGLQRDAPQAVLQLPHHQLLAQPLLLGEAAGVDGLEAGEEAFGLLLLQLGVGQRGVAEAVVVAVVADDGGGLRRILEVVLPLLRQQAVQRLDPGGDVAAGAGRGGVGLGRRQGAQRGDSQRRQRQLPAK